MVVFADEGADLLARLAGYFAFPIEARRVVGASSQRAEPEPLPVLLPGPEGAESLLEVLESRDLEVVLEDGSWRGELLGLEVARVVRWPVETGGDGLLHIEAGVGRFDRDATAAMHRGEDPVEGLGRAIEMVRRHRHPGAAPHPVSLAARPRWLRAAAIADPARVGAAELTAVQTTFPPSSVRETSPAAALGTGQDGRALLVVFSTGASLDLVPVAADTRALVAPDATLRLAVPARDRLAALDDLASLLVTPAEVVDVSVEWS